MENILFKCEFCCREFKTKNACNSHRGKCKQNPNAKDNVKSKKWLEAMKNRKPSNQFIKAKEEGKIITSKLKGRESTFKGKHHTDETKKKLSSIMKEKIIKGTFIVPYKRNHSSKISYPEKYFLEVFKELPVKYNYQVGLYQLDFAIPEKKVYIEIDGEQHYVDKRIVEHDIDRTNKLDLLGWKCLRRVKWSKYQKLSQKEKDIFCEELKCLFTK